MSAKEWGYIAPNDEVPTRLQTDVNRVDQSALDMRRADAESMGNIEAVSTAFTSGSNVAYQTYRMYDEIASSGPIDPAWNDGVESWMQTNNIDPAIQWRFKATGNEKEATMLLARMRENEQKRQMLELRGGVSTFVAEMAAGLIDIDLPLMLMTGGLSNAAKIGIQSSKANRVFMGGLEGAASAGLVGAGSVAVNPNEDWSILPAMLLGGTALGSIGGALRPGAPVKTDGLADAANRTMQDVHNDIGENLAAGTPASRPHGNGAVDDLDPWGSKAMADAEDALADGVEPPRTPQTFSVDTAEPGASSAGAAATPGTGKRPLSDIQAERKRLIVENARKRDADLDLENQIDDTFQMRPVGSLQDFKVNFLYNSAVRLAKIVGKTFASNDFNRIINTDTAVGRVLAYDLFESPMGVLRNNDNAARYFQDYKTRALTTIEQTPDIYYEWAKRNKGMNMANASLSQETQEAFNREVIQEQMNRFYGRGSTTTDPAVKAAADAYDRMYKYTAEVEKGRPGEGSVHGSDRLTPKSGYTPQAWSGAKMRNLIESGRYKKEDIATAIKESYKINYPNMKDADLQIYARAVVDRFMAKNDGTSVSISSWINADGRSAVEDFLARQTGISQQKAQQIIDGLTGTRMQKGRAGYFKERMDVDFSFKASNGIEMMDLLDTDLRGLAERRAHRSAGQAALARKGIGSRADYEAIVDAIIEEQNLYQKPAPSGATGAKAVADKISDMMNQPKHLDRNELMEMYNYFIGAPLYGGISPTTASIKKLTNLSLLNQLGLAQMAEWGTNMSAVGAREFFRRLPDAIRASMRNKDSPLMKELSQLGVYTPDDRLHRFDQTYSTERLSSEDTAWLAKMNSVMNVAGRVQGFTSLFYTMNRAQHHMAVDIAVTNLMKHFNGTKVMTSERLRDALGDTTTLGPKLKHYAENVVQYDGNGDVVTLNLDQWHPSDVDALSRYINANVRQQVQRAMIGESNTRFYSSDLAALFWHLKSFPLLAMEKQFARNAMIGDPQAMGSFLYGLGWASLAYTTKQIVNGNTDNLDYDKIARGALNMSNMTGWLPMWADPLMGMLGHGEYGLGGYNGRNTSIVSVPAVFPTLDRMLQIPGALLGDGSTSDIRAIQSFPIIGNAYGFSFLFNTMKDGVQEYNRIQRRAERQEDQTLIPSSGILEKAVEGTNIPL